jgi:hypothetical protein
MYWEWVRSDTISSGVWMSIIGFGCPKQKHKGFLRGMDFKPNKKTSFVAYEFVALSLSILSFTFHPKQHSFPSDILIPKHSQVREREKERERERGGRELLQQQQWW